jgi:alkylhydroperoxidase family enzyme
VPDPVWDAAAAHFDESELAGLVTAIALVNLWNRINAATRQPAGSAW